MPIVTWSESFPPKPAFTVKDMPDQSGRVFIVTGGASGCGYETAKVLYQLNGRVYIAGRSAANAKAAIEKIKSSPVLPEQKVVSGKGSLDFLPVDLADLTTIKPCAENFLSKEDRLDVIWHNAGVMGIEEGSKTKQGFEAHLGTNALGPFALQHFLTPICLKTAARPDVKPNSTRVIWVTSAGHRGSPKPDGVNWDDINMHSLGGIKGAVAKYGQSKAMNVMHAHEMARRYGKQGLISVALHPGSLKTNLQRHQGFFFKHLTAPLLYDQYYGGLTELWAGLHEEVDTRMLEGGGKNGAYVQPWGRWGQGSQHVYEGLAKRKTGERLWELCETTLKEWM
ncbi:hypothetical protein F5884DRAFT_861683 [Xylogone sp. PMI_703]|nr:hypothetical protein F5884DRAFT_861683 [Xylogone sp. PMI_703]